MFCVKTKKLPYYDIKHYDFVTRREALNFLEKEGYERDAVGYGFCYEYLTEFYWNSETDRTATIFEFER